MLFVISGVRKSLIVFLQHCSLHLRDEEDVFCVCQRLVYEPTKTLPGTSDFWKLSGPAHLLAPGSPEASLTLSQTSPTASRKEGWTSAARAGGFEQWSAVMHVCQTWPLMTAFHRLCSHVERAGKPCHGPTWSGGGCSRVNRAAVCGDVCVW